MFDENEIICEMYVHLIWSTKNQEPSISPSTAQYLSQYICDITLSCKCHVIKSWIFADHLELIVKFGVDTALSDLVTSLKVSTALLLRTHSAENAHFEWQKSDFIFSVCPEYIESIVDLASHTKSFEDKIRCILDEHKMEYDVQEILD